MSVHPFPTWLSLVNPFSLLRSRAGVLTAGDLLSASTSLPCPGRCWYHGQASILTACARLSPQPATQPSEGRGYVFEGMAEPEKKKSRGEIKSERRSTREGYRTTNFPEATREGRIPAAPHAPQAWAHRLGQFAGPLAGMLWASTPLSSPLQEERLKNQVCASG